MRSVGRCTAYRSCRRYAVYYSPAKLCSKHWTMWFWRCYDGRNQPAFIAAINAKLESLRETLGESIAP